MCAWSAALVERQTTTSDSRVGSGHGGQRYGGRGRVRAALAGCGGSGRRATTAPHGAIAAATTTAPVRAHSGGTGYLAR
jgi:hypothetical protein